MLPVGRDKLLFDILHSSRYRYLEFMMEEFGDLCDLGDFNSCDGVLIFICSLGDSCLGLWFLNGLVVSFWRYLLSILEDFSD